MLISQKVVFLIILYYNIAIIKGKLMKTCSLPPDAASFMWSIRAIGYTAETAVADLIDNSISAEATKIEIEFSSYIDNYISILDDGNGMSREELILAMKYGACNPLAERSSTDLGRFGLGLKTASLSQCRELTVLSKKEGHLNAFCWDLDFIINEAKDWCLKELDVEELEKIPQYDKLLSQQEGTIVLWRNLDKLYAGLEDKEDGLLIKMTEIIQHLALTFHRYIQGEAGLKKLSIVCNGNILKPIDPFYTEKSSMMFSEAISLNINKKNSVQKERIIVTPYILPYPETLSQIEINELGGKDGLMKNQGFYIYRNKRLIVSANWFRLARKTDLTKLCRVKVDIPNSMDEEWTLDVKKSMAIPPADVVKNLKRIISRILQAGKRKYKTRAKKENSPRIKVWTQGETREGVIYTINRNYPILKELFDCGNINRQKLEIMLKLIEQNIPFNTIHSDFHEDKRIAYEDVNYARSITLKELQMLVAQADKNDRRKTFDMLMEISPFEDYDFTYEEVVGING